LPGTKDDRVRHRAGLFGSNVLEFYLRDSFSRSRPQHDKLHYFFLQPSSRILWYDLFQTTTTSIHTFPKSSLVLASNLQEIYLQHRKINHNRPSVTNSILTNNSAWSVHNSRTSRYTTTPWTLHGYSCQYWHLSGF